MNLFNKIKPYVQMFGTTFLLSYLLNEVAFKGPTGTRFEDVNRDRLSDLIYESPTNKSKVYFINVGNRNFVASKESNNIGFKFESLDGKYLFDSYGNVTIHNSSSNSTMPISMANFN